MQQNEAFVMVKMKEETYEQNQALEKQLVGRDDLFLGSSLGPSSSLL